MNVAEATQAGEAAEAQAGVEAGVHYFQQPQQ